MDELNNLIQTLKFKLDEVNRELNDLSVYNFVYDPDMVEKIKTLNADKLSIENKIKSLEDTKE
ncbi:MAG: hypothetical protein ACI39B_06885 [Methanobrevibacter smithii]